MTSEMIRKVVKLLRRKWHLLRPHSLALYSEKLEPPKVNKALRS